MLIEKEAVLKKAITIIDEFEWENLVIAYDDVANAPDAQKHGKWLQPKWFAEEENVYVCSECDAAFQLMVGDPEENEYFYCPRCGAKMTNEQIDFE